MSPAEVDGIEADQYRIEADDATREALAELAPTELAWFELEHPQQVTSIEIWVADDLIRRIEVTVDHSDSPTERWRRRPSTTSTSTPTSRSPR